MAVCQIQSAVRLEEVGDDLRPAPHVGQPTKRAPGYVDEVERLGLGNRGRSIIDIGSDEARPGLQAELLRQLPRRVYGGSGKIGPTTIGAALASVRVSMPK